MFGIDWIACVVHFVISSSCFFFVKQKTAYEMRISDWSSDVCSSDLDQAVSEAVRHGGREAELCPGCAFGDRAPRDRAQDRRARASFEIGRASCRERVCQSV